MKNYNLVAFLGLILVGVLLFGCTHVAKAPEAPGTGSGQLDDGGTTDFGDVLNTSQDIADVDISDADVDAALQ